ncbi:MAG: choice-of-anchor Q domain-containing protein [Verrucomicrobiota bacterium]
MTTTVARKHSRRRRGILASPSKRKTRRGRAFRALRCWQHITRYFRFFRGRKIVRSQSPWRTLWRTFGSAALALCLPVMAQAITVDTDTDVTDGDTSSITNLEATPGPDGNISLREALIAANNTVGTDGIDFDPSLSGAVINLTQGELAINDTVIVSGSDSGGVPLAQPVVIDAGGTSRVMSLSASTLGAFFSLSNLTLRNGGTTATGGGLSINAGYSGSVNLTDCDINGNSCDTNGGGIHVASGNVTLADSIVSGNYAGGGAAGRGGGIYVASGRLTLTNSAVSGNYAFATIGGTGYGGGIYASAGVHTLDNSTVNGNYAEGDYAYGGGIHLASGFITITNSTISGNSAEGAASGGYSYGGGIHCESGVLSLTNCTVANNSANGEYGYGGGIYSKSSTAQSFALTSSIIAGNSASVASPDIRSSNPGTVLVVEQCLIGDSTGADLGSANFAARNLVDVDPLLEPLADNGGPTQTHALPFGSPAIDQGTATGLDQRGLARPVDDPSIANTLGYTNGSDIGAFERQSVLTPIVVTTEADGVPNPGDGLTTLREAINQANGNAGPDAIGFAADLSGDVIVLNQGELAVSDDLVINASNLAEPPVIDADESSRVVNLSGGSLTLDGLTLRNGVATGNGGGVNTTSGAVSLINSTISSCSAETSGGGISSDSGAVSLLNSTVSNCSAENGSAAASGGGIYSNSGAVSITNSTVSGNSAGTLTAASAFGGGVRTNTGVLAATNSTIAENSVLSSTASVDGGGISTNAGTLLLTNSLISENSASGLGAPDLSSPDPANDLEVSYCLIGDSTGAGLGSAKVNVNNVSDVDPLLDPLADNGGPTQTHALLVGSPAIDQGLAYGVDQRGLPRIDDGFISNAPGGNGSDIGAFEYQAPPILVTTNADGVPNPNDGVLTLREAVNLANGTASGTNTIGFDPSLSGQSIVLTEGELAITNDVVIDASDIDEPPVVDGDENSRIMNFTGESLILNSLILQDGKAPIIQIGTNSNNQPILSSRGGGIYSPTGAVTLINSAVIGSRAYDSGGGIFTDSGAVTLANSAVSDNSVVGPGGGGNSGGYGGGIFTETGVITLTNSTISGNFAGSGSSGYADGAGISAGLGGITLTNSTISGNIASGYYAYGGGINSGGGMITLINSTLVNNSSGGYYGYGGGINANTNGAELSLVNSIIAGNSVLSSGPDINSGIFLGVDYCLIGDDSNTSVGSAPGGNNIIGTSGSPVDPLLGNLADNGGPTQTHALLVGSPAIDQGSATGLDQRGFPRLDDPATANAIGGNGSDIGAFELVAPIWLSDIDNDGNPFGVEQALGTDPSVSDRDNSLNLDLTDPAFNADGQPVVSFGIANDAVTGTLWILERSTDLKNFDEIYRFDGTTEFVNQQFPVAVETTANGVEITDLDPPLTRGYYRFRAPLPGA